MKLVHEQTNGVKPANEHTNARNVCYFHGFWEFLFNPPETFEAVSGLQFCWQAQDFQAFFVGKGAKVLVYAVFRACGNFRGLWPQTFRPQSSFSCHGARWLVDALGGDGPRGVGHGAGLASQLGCRGGRAAKSRGQDRLKEEHTITRASMPKP